MTWDRVPNQSAIAYLKDKTPIPTTQWNQVSGEAANFGFAVAGITKAEILQSVQESLVKALEDGTGLSDFVSAFDATATRNGWIPGDGFDAYRMGLIFNQNLRGAYAAGRYEQMSDPEMLKRRPYWQIAHGNSRHPRPAHLALDGKIYPADSDFWKTCYFPAGFGCKCRVFPLSPGDIDRESLSVDDPPDERVTIVDKLSGKSQSVSAINGQPIAEPGFANIPGASLKENRQAILESAISRLPDYLQGQVRKDLNG